MLARILLWVAVIGALAAAKISDACVPLSYTGGGTSVTYSPNALGEPRISGNTTAVDSYDPYGVPGSSNVSRFQYTGQTMLAEIGLYDYKARIYNPQLGRFMQTDPVGYAAGDFDLYTYVGNDPFNKTDPTGTTVFDLGFLAYDAVRFGRAVYSGVGIGSAAIDVAISLVGVASPIPGTSPLLKTFRGAEHAVEAVRGVEKVADAAKEAGIVANGIRGRASEARVLNELGLAKNTTAVSTAEGRSIPDALTRSLSVEVKDAANVSLTRQLRIQTEAARASGRESVLITGENTCVSGACSRAFDTIIRRPDLEAAND